MAFVPKPGLFLLLFLVELWSCQAAILKLRESRIQAEKGTPVRVPAEAIQHELYNRMKRESSTSGGKRNTTNPVVTEAPLSDTNNVALIYYVGNDSKIIFVVTYQSLDTASLDVSHTRVHRSEDYGKTFVNINSVITNDTDSVLFPALYTSPEDQDTVYMLRIGQSIMYISSDRGLTFTTRVLSPDTIDTSSFKVHTKVHGWVLAKSQTNELYYSKDFGQTPFKKISDNVRDFQWGEDSYDQDTSLIYYSTYSSVNIILNTQHLPYNDATGKQFDPQLGPHDGYLIVGRYIFAQKTIDGVVSLWVSTDRKPFKRAKIPSNDGHLGYIVGSIRSIQALVIVQHDNGRFNLYMSEEQGVLYNLALEDIVVEDGSTDIQTIESMNHTTFIANQNVRRGSGSNPSTRTLISFDTGGNWESLTPPTTSDTECIQPLCSLHLHMSTSEYWRTGVYSQESAPGIIIAHGTTGQYLNDDNTNLFISRDGGVSWYQTLNGTWGVSVLDLGGLIVAARDYHSGTDESKTLKYSCDEGITWSDLTFTSNNLHVYAVITETGEATTVASLYGADTTNSWVVDTIDFANIFPRDCGASDYYGWTPFDDNTDTGCLLGASISVERHKPSVCCRNGRSYERVISYSVCECSVEDFECDYGYKHANGISGSCVRDTTIVLPRGCIGDNVSYVESQGYHKIGGDVCTGGVESTYSPYTAPCCNAIPPSVSVSISVSIVTRTVTSSTQPSSAGLSNHSSTDNIIVIILAVILISCVSIIGLLCIVTVGFFIIKKKRVGSNRNYSAVPSVTYHPNTAIRDTSPLLTDARESTEDEDDEPLKL